MERLPYIDELVTSVRSGREQAWDAVLAIMRGSFTGAASGPFARALGAQPGRSGGVWPEPGAAVPGFAVAHARRPERLELRGRHRFSTYALIFELDETGPGSTQVRAKTYAAFPGVRGRAYRALVIGTGAHRIVVQRMLAAIARRSQRATA
jgi:hypothetical protein